MAPSLPRDSALPLKLRPPRSLARSLLSSRAVSSRLLLSPFLSFLCFFQSVQ
ncbi:hypothetical protein Mapa_016480 [Marchantia paleacea]|nr:hypothetical protein Mapa_016480 [Marchantia paleacea]